MYKTDQPQPIRQVQTHPLARGISLATLGIKAGARLGSYSLASLWMDGEQRRQAQHQMLVEQAMLLAEELGKLKGSVMKVGQVLALYGDYLFLPPEIVETLRTLQDNSPPLEWNALRPVLERELGTHRLAELDVDPVPLAAASLGQVHRARCKGRDLCIKIQYPGVAESIAGDLNTLATLLMFSRLLPRGFSLEAMMQEIREMLEREVDYQLEFENTERFRKLLQSDDRFRIPDLYPEYSTARVLTASYETGLPVDSAETQALPQEQRNRIGAAALELFLREFFEWNLMQTDPNFGNYRIRMNAEHGLAQLVLLDFGAVRQFSPAFRHAYFEMVKGAFWKDRERLWNAAVALQFMPPRAARADLERFADMCFLIVEPFSSPDRTVEKKWFNAQGEYRWGQSDLPQRVALAASLASLSISFRIPPREFVFLHRKLGGVFVFLAELDAELKGYPLLLPYM
jgi:predicted unusual protein kinase regulating ubiquinone biosynthesis (AarF/ABC1/UbiB family)